MTRPIKALKGYKRLHLQPGQSATVTFNLDLRHLAFYDRRMDYVVEPGTVEIMICSSSADIRCAATLEIVGETQVVNPVYHTPMEIAFH